MLRLEEQADLLAKHEAIMAEFDKLPETTRARLRADFERERARGASVTWSRYVEVLLPLLPIEARG